MNYSIIGSGAIGSALAGHFASKGIEVSLANNRGPGSLTDIVGKLGSKVKAATVEESILADVVILAVPFPAVPDAVSSISDWGGSHRHRCYERCRSPSFYSNEPGWAVIQRYRGRGCFRRACSEGVQYLGGSGPSEQSRRGRRTACHLHVLRRC